MKNHRKIHTLLKALPAVLLLAALLCGCVTVSGTTPSGSEEPSNGRESLSSFVSSLESESDPLSITQGPSGDSSATGPVSPLPTDSDGTASEQTGIRIASMRIFGPEELPIGTSDVYTAEILPENANEKYTLRVDRPEVISLAPDGTATAHVRGNAVIIAEAEDGRELSRYRVRAVNNVQKIVITAQAQSLETDQTVRLHAQVLPEDVENTGVWWQFSEPISTGKAEVRADQYDCYVTALEAGNVKITCGSNDRSGLSVTYTLKVLPSSRAELEIIKSSLTVARGESEKISVRMKNCSGLVFKSANEAIAKVNAEGVVTGVSEGKTTITVSADGGSLKKECAVTVVKPYASYTYGPRYDENGLPCYKPVYEKGVTYVDYPGKQIKHLFAHCLVAFDDPTDMFWGECITATEFKRMIAQMYDRGYILIDIDYMYDYYYDADGVLCAKVAENVKVPEGKIPFILSIDNVAYPRWEHGKGRSDRLQVINGKLYTYTKLDDGTEIYSDDNEVFTILENFVKIHPDFSFSGAKCVVAPSGGEGLFGWDTMPGKANREESLREAQKIANWFRDHGFVFCSHSYSHKNFRDMTPDQIKNDFKKWTEECLPTVGRTHIFILPFGACPNENSEQAKTLHKLGFAVFCGTTMGAKNVNDHPIKGVAYNQRVILTSQMLTLFKDKEPLISLFDPYTVYDNDAHSKKIYR